MGKTISQVAFDAIRHFSNNFYATKNGYSVSEFGNAGFETVMAICISTMSISHRKQ